MAAGSYDKAIIVYDASTLTPSLTIQTEKPVWALAWSPDGKILASNKDSQITLWDAQTGQLLGTLSGHTGSVTSLDWSEDGRLASASLDGTVRVWQIDAGK